MDLYPPRTSAGVRAVSRLATPILALCAALLFSGAAWAQAQDAGPEQRLTLKQTVTLALQRSREVALANLRYDLAKRESGVHRSEFLPNLYAGSGAAYTRGSPLFAGGGTPSLFTLSYDQALFNPLARSEVHVAEQTAEQQRLAAQDASNSVAVRAASSYLELAKVRRQLDLMRKGRDSAQKILDFTKDRTDAGYELPIEVTKAQLTAARIEQRIAVLEDQDDTLTDELRDMLGYPEDTRIEVATEELPGGATQSVNDLEVEALQSNIAVQQAESEQKSSSERLKGARGAYWPTIGVVAQYNLLAKYNDYDLFFKRFQANNFIGGVEIKTFCFCLPALCHRPRSSPPRRTRMRPSWRSPISAVKFHWMCGIRPGW